MVALQANTPVNADAPRRPAVARFSAASRRLLAS